MKTYSELPLLLDHSLHNNNMKKKTKKKQFPLCLQKEIAGASQLCTKSFLAKVPFELIKNC